MIPVDLLNYQLIRLLGRGGMGEVYLARNKNIEQYVAVKALHPKYANNPMIRSRFKQEAVMLNSLNHPNIVKFLNFVENEYGVLLIMEYVEGQTLEDFIMKKNGLIVEKKAYPIFTEILNAFSYAHQHGIIHRDIKPSNILLDRNGHVKIMDFGIAQIISEVNEKTIGGMAMGTPAYMSPEQVFGQPLNQRSDIYSLGVLFHQMLTGRAPYDSTTMSEMEIKGHVVNEKLPRMKNYYPYISDGMQQVVDKATAKKPEGRFATCDEMFRAVKNVLAPEQKSRTPLYMAAAVVVLCLLIGCGLWDYFRTKVSYYKDYAEVYGVAKGIGYLSGREVAHRQSSYRIESSRRKVRRITLVNSQDKPVKHQDTEHINSRFTDVWYYYSDNGYIDYKKAYDEYGKLLYKIDYDENLRVAMFKYDDEHGTAKRLQQNTTGLFNINETERSSITRYLLSYDEEGHLQSIKYASGEDNVPVGDAENIYGQAYSYDEKGRITEIRFLGQDGKVRGNKIGLAIKRYEYDDDDNWTLVKYLSATGKPSHDGNNCPVVKIAYDKWGNRASEKYYTSEGKPAYRTDVASCGFDYEYDSHGFRVLQSFVGSDGKTIFGKTGFARLRSEYDKNGFVTSETYEDKEGNRVSMVDDEGNAYGRIDIEVNEKGSVLSMSYFDVKGNAIEDAFGIHRAAYEYDSLGNRTRESFMDKELQPTTFSGFNSSLRITYNDRGLRQSMSYYDKDGKLTYNQNGIAMCQYTYDKMGNIVKYEYIDKDGKTLVNGKDGYAVEEVSYDALGNMKSIHHYNSSLKPCITSSGYHSTEYFYDPNTNFLTEVKFFLADGKLLKSNHFKYDANGNQTSSWTQNSSGGLSSDNVTNIEYDDNNRVTKIYDTNLSGQRVNMSGTQYCEVDIKLDDRGNVIEHTYWNVNGKPSCDEHKTHKRIREYDEYNHCIYEKSLDKDGKPTSGSNAYPEGKVTYDEHGNMTSLTCFDGYGKPYVCPDGYYRMEMNYNEYNLRSSVFFKDVKGNLVKHKTNEYAKVTYDYDEKRNLVKETHFGTSGSMTGYITYAYNEKRSLTEYCIYNSNERLDNSKVFSKMLITYEEDGVTPKKKTYYNRGSVFAWQSYNRKTGQWGTLSF